ncbi:Methionine--tRNA ligase, mitochondrial, partial [Fragariocoptes setiger]
MLKQLVSNASYAVTTPIFYVNSSPHIGHLHSALIADALFIFNKLKLLSRTGPVPKLLFSTGTDEHGIKVSMASQAQSQDCRQFCDINSAKFRHLFERFELNITDFVRTTEDRHRRAVEAFWTRLDNNGAIFKSNYSGYYCPSDETFVPPNRVVFTEDGRPIDDSGNSLEMYEEDNYMFKLSDYRDEILRWLRLSKVILPSRFNDEAIAMLCERVNNQPAIGDISISRPSSRLKWGIRVPNDESQTIYVWLDALVNYLTVVGYPNTVPLVRWPIDCQVIGKDILKFHAIYWPAFLMAANMNLPKRIICHSHWLLNSTKMSKSRGNVIDPMSEADSISPDGLRYYLLRVSTSHSDSDYNHTTAVRMVNADLADNIGNLLSRCCAKAINTTQIVPTSLKCSNISSTLGPKTEELTLRLAILADECDQHYSVANFYRGLDQIMACLRLANVIFHEKQPWVLVKEGGHRNNSTIHDLLVLMIECLRICSIVMEPIVPRLSQKIYKKLGFQNTSWSDAKMRDLNRIESESDRSINNESDAILFRRIREQLK